MELVQGHNEVNSDGGSLRMYSPETAELGFELCHNREGDPRVCLVRLRHLPNSIWNRKVSKSSDLMTPIGENLCLRLSRGVPVTIEKSQIEGDLHHSRRRPPLVRDKTKGSQSPTT